MFQTIVIIILIGIIIYLILDKKNIKTNDIKNYVKELRLKIKTKLSKVTEKLTILFGKMKESIKSHHEKMKQQQAEAKLRREFERQEKESNTFEEKQDFDMKNQTQPVEKVKVVKKGGFFSTLLFLILIVCAGLFAYKKIMLDFDGAYATDRLVYSDEYEFCMLITYYPPYQKGNAKGFAVTHIPFGALFTEKVQANKYGNDTADSKDMLDAYQLLATWGDNDLVDSLTKSLSSSEISTKSLDIGNHGKYFILNAKDLGYENPDFIRELQNGMW